MVDNKNDDNMTIKEYQHHVDRWINDIGVRYFDPLTNTAILMEEVGELARIMAREYGEQSWKRSAVPSNLADEMADLFFVLTCLANQCDIDLTEAVKRNMLKKSGRDKERHHTNPKLQR